MYPKSKSPSELKYERLRGMCGGAGRTCDILRNGLVYLYTTSWRTAGENVRYIPIDNGIQQHGRAWRYMVGAACISVYRRGDRAARYTCVRYTNTVYNRHHQSFATPGCVYRVRVRVRALYYYIIIIL